MSNSLIILVTSIVLCLACTGDSGESANTSGGTVGNTGGTNNQPAMGGGSNDTGDTTNTGSNPVIRDLSEDQAIGIMGASCIGSDCHAIVDEIINSPQILPQLTNKIMPPSNQGRYTLSDTRRQELILFFQNRGTP